MIRAFASMAIAAAVAGCTPAVPQSNAGVGFDDYADYELQRARREAALAGSGSTAFPTASAATTVTPPGNFAPRPGGAAAPAIAASELAAAGIGGAGAANGGAPLTAMAPATPAEPVVSNNPTLSDEQSFEAVTARETIQSDAERRAAAAAVRQEVAPTALPTRPADTGPNIVAYALNAPNVKGQEWYSRSLLSGQSRFQRNCASYNSPDAAQRDFLARGGPERDPRGIDPDGDGFACGWDPAPFKLAAGN